MSIKLSVPITEYANGVDILWAVSHLYLFSSFNRGAIYFRPIILIIKFLLVIATSAFFNNLVEQVLEFRCVLDCTMFQLHPA